MAQEKSLRTGLVSDVRIPLPADMVAASGGFSLDIGSSMAKIIYRSNQEYKEGVKIDRTGDSKKGIVHYALFPRNDLDGVINYLKDNCDFKRNAEGIVEVNSSGVGGATFKKAIESQLKAKMHVVDEFGAFTKAFLHRTKTMPIEEMVYPLSERVKEECAKLEETFAKVYSNMMKSTPTLKIGPDVTAEDEKAKSAEKTKDGVDDNQQLPCLLGMCGSGTAFFVIEKDGSSRVFEGPYLGGRGFYGLASYLGGTNDFKKLVEMASKGDGKSVDIWMSDLATQDEFDEKDEKNFYSTLTESDAVAMPFGKLIHQKEENVSREDLVCSAYITSASLHLQFAHYISLVTKVRKVFFCGNLFDNEVGQEIFYLRKSVMDSFKPKEHKLDVHFIRNGGNLGVLGAFMTPLKPV